MLQTWEALRLEEIMVGGRTKPLLIDCARQEGTRTARERFVVKAIGLPEVHPFTLCHECLGVFLAQRLGVRAPDVALVRLGSEFVSATADTLKRRGLARLSVGIGVGTRYLTGLMPMPPHPQLRDDHIQDAARIYAMDMAFQNPDRRASNPNCGYDCDELVAFDFENAFSFRFLIGKGPEPHLVTRLDFRKEHVFYQRLRASPVTWAGCASVFAKLGEDPIAEIRSSIPADWLDAAEAISSHLVMIAKHVREFELELGRSLQ